MRGWRLSGFVFLICLFSSAYAHAVLQDKDSLAGLSGIDLSILVFPLAEVNKPQAPELRTLWKQLKTDVELKGSNTRL